jgi:hypothetical protein
MTTKIRLDYVAFGVKYGSGHLYFDRSGQCLLDIERQCPGWGMVSIDIHTGRIENPEKSLIANFDNKEFSFTSQKPNILSMEEIAREISGVWKVVQANFALEEFVRVGVRFSYLLPTESIEESDALLKRSEMNIVLPVWLQRDTYLIKNRQIIAVLTKDETEFRVELAAVTRHEGMNPSDLTRTDARLLSKNQNKFRIAKLKQMAQYSANPMFAVHLNVDCADYGVESFSVEESVLRYAEVVKADFLPLLIKL